MRNLKRALSLTLASVMLLGMMVVGSSAAAGYSDVDENDNVEAIEVLQAVEVMVGDDRGFGPDRPVTRNEMAVVMGKLLNLDYNYYSESCPFTDVATWAKGWVGAAAANGIVSGRGNGIYDGEATVTAVEAASMMMRALGYFKYQNDYADGFRVSTVRQGTKIGIFDQVGTDATTPMTRNQVAQMALNALQTGMVEPDGNTINLTTPDGSVFTGKVNYVYVTSNKDFAGAISTTKASSIGSQNDSPIVELGEQLYNGKLKLFDGKVDDFGRPSRKWEYDGKAIGTYMKKELIREEYTSEVKGKDLYDLLGSDTIKEYDFEITIDGVDVGGKTGTTDHDKVLKTKASSSTPYSGGPASYFDRTYMAKTYKDTIGATGNGTLTQVFVDPDWGKDGKVWVSVINTYLAKATTDYNDKKDEVSYDVFALDSTGSGNNEVFFKYKDACKVPKAQSKKLTVSGDDFNIEDVKKDDIVLVTEANGVIKTISDPEVLSAVTLNAFSKNKYVVTGGETYNYTTTTEYDVETLESYTGEPGSATQQLKDTDYNVYLDQYGYAIGVEVVEAAKNYIFLTGIDQAASNLRNKTADAAGILMDGTFVQFTMDTKNSEAYWTHGNVATSSYANAKNKVGRFAGGPLWNTWCSYTVDKDGVYTLKEVKGWEELKADDSKEKAGQSKDLSYFNKSIDSKHVSLRAWDLKAPTDRYVYGNDETVYIVPSLEAVKSDTSFNTGDFKIPKANGTNSADGTNTAAINEKQTYVGIIDDVDTVTTGIKNVNLKTVKGQTELVGQVDGKPSSWADPSISGVVYPLFDEDGYVIAAVVIGEDDGVSKNLVYCDSDKPIEEAYSDADDEWSWQREVIFNGERTTLLEKGDKLSKLSAANMKENVWYEVTYKADGSVKDIQEAYYDEYGKRVGEDTVTVEGTHYDAALDRTTGNSDSQAEAFVDKIDWVENAINNSDKNTVLYEEVWGKVTDEDGTVNTDAVNAAKAVMTVRPSLKGHTLYVDTVANKGFYVNDDVKSVLIQKNDGAESISWGTNASDLEDFLDDLNKDAKKGFIFKISAVLVGGHGTVVVIHDWNETGATQSGDNKKPSTPVGDVYVDIDNLGAIEVFTTKKSLTTPEGAEAILAALEEAGYTVPGDGETGAPEIDASGDLVGKVKKGGMTYNIKWDVSANTNTEALNVKWDGNDIMVKSDGKIKGVTGATAATQYLKLTEKDATTSTFETDYDDDTDTLKEGMTVETGYYKVTVTGGVTKVDLDASGMVTPDGGTNYYALGTSEFTVKNTTHGTGVKVNDGSDDWYFAYGSTFADMYKKCGASAAGVVAITGIEQVAVTIKYAGVDKTVADVVKPFAYNNAIAAADVGADSAGTGLCVGESKNGTVVANATGITATQAQDDVTVWIGYTDVKLAANADNSKPTGVTIKRYIGSSTTAIADPTAATYAPVGTTLKVEVDFGTNNTNISDGANDKITFAAAAGPVIDDSGATYTGATAGTKGDTTTTAGSIIIPENTTAVSGKIIATITLTKAEFTTGVTFATNP